MEPAHRDLVLVEVEVVHGCRVVRVLVVHAVIAPIECSARDRQAGAAALVRRPASGGQPNTAWCRSSPSAAVGAGASPGAAAAARCHPAGGASRATRGTGSPAKGSGRAASIRADGIRARLPAPKRRPRAGKPRQPQRQRDC